MTTENIGATAGHANVAQCKLQDAACAHNCVANGVLGLAHAPYDGRRLGRGKHFRQLVHARLRHAAGLFHLVWRPFGQHFGLDLVHAIDAIVDVLGVFPTVLENVVQHAEQKGDVGARTNAHVFVGFGRCACEARINHDQLSAGFFRVQHVQHRHRMRLGGVRPDVERTLGVLHVVVRVGHRAIAPGVGNTSNRG